MISRKEPYRSQPASRLIVPARPTQFGPSGHRRDVAYWHKADTATRFADVRFRCNSGHNSSTARRLLLIQSGH